MMDDLTLGELLEWAKSLKMYIEIFGNGSAEIEFDPDLNYEYEDYAEGDTLFEALNNARAKFLNGE